MTSLLILIGFSLVALSLCCSPRYTYTECNPVTHTRWAVEYFVASDSGCDEKPKPAVELQCDINCPSGSALIPPATSCQTCPAGTFSISNTRWQLMSGMPENTNTYCTGDGCSKWYLSDAMLISGNQSTDGEVSTSLNYFFTTYVDNANMNFEYRVSSEAGYDVFRVFLDNTEVPLRNGLTYDSGRMYSFQRIDAKITNQGPHMLEFRYSKDKTTSKGLDQAQVRQLFIEKTTRTATECTPCPPGYYSNKSSDECNTCDINSVPYPNATGCAPCLSTEYATPGTTTCLVRPICDILGDFYLDYDTCDIQKSMRNATYVKRPSSHCYDPPDTAIGGRKLLVQCNACPEGMEKTPDGERCVSCMDGMSSDGNNPCTPCPAGTAAVRTVTYNDATLRKGLPPSLKAVCYDSPVCPTPDKVLMVSPYIGQGQQSEDEYVNMGPMLTLSTSDRLGTTGWKVNITLDFDWYTHGSFSLDYGFEYADGLDALISLDINLYVGNDIIVPVDAVPELWPNQKRNSISVPYIPKGFRRVTLMIVSGAHIDTTFRMIIFRMNATGVVEGLADKCVSCLAGYACGTGAREFSPCLAGSSSVPGSQFCSMCPTNSITAMPGTPKCVVCPPTTIANARQTSCTASCNFTFDLPEWGVVQYNVSELNNIDFGPVFETVFGVDTTVTQSQADENDSWRYSFRLCSPLETPCTTPIQQVSASQVATDGAQACLRVNAVQQYVLGRTALFQPNTSNPIWGFTADFLFGDKLSFDDVNGAIAINGSGMTSRSQLQVQFLCSKSSAPVVTFRGTKNTTFLIAVETLFACAQCLPQYYVDTWDKCNATSGLRTLQPVLHPLYSGCIGTPPPSRKVPCRYCNMDDYIKTFSPCDGNKQFVYYTLKSNSSCDEYATMELAVQTCHSIDVSGTVNVVTVSVTVTLAVFLLLCVVIVYCWRKNRRLQSDYEALAHPMSHPSGHDYNPNEGGSKDAGGHHNNGVDGDHSDPEDTEMQVPSGPREMS